MAAQETSLVAQEQAMAVRKATKKLEIERPSTEENVSQAVLRIQDVYPGSWILIIWIQI